MPRITPFLWFATEAEDAATYYVSIIPNSRIVNVMRQGPDGPVVAVSFELDGQRFSALNGRPPGFAFTDATSFAIDCATQEEVDRYWNALTRGGTEGQCGWLKDKFGVSWQVVPTALPKLLGDPDPARAQRVFQAMMPMKKLDITVLERAARG